MQMLANHKRGKKDSRTARVIKASLPNELLLPELKKLCKDFVTNNFTSRGMCADIAIHRGQNLEDTTKNNPHVHILLTDRPVDENGFLPKKDRTWNERDNIEQWRRGWANTQNRAYARNGLSIRVSHESYKARGIDKEPRRYLSRIDYQLEQQGIQTARGNENRRIKVRNQERVQQQERNNRREHSR